MDNTEKAKRLKAMLAQIAPGNNLESLPRPKPRKSAPGVLEGLETVLDDNRVVQTGLDKLKQDREHELTASEMNGLEAIVMTTMRPVVFVRGNGYDDLKEEPWLGLNDPAVKARISSLLPSIGRVELPNSMLAPYGGTGFVVGKNLMMTNRHVAQLFSQGLGLKIRFQPGDSAVDFKKQVDTPRGDSDSFDVTGVVMIHPYWDMALLQVDGVPKERMLSLSIASPEELVGNDIVAVGYPAQDFRNDLAVQDRIFEGIYQVKRLHPGKVRVRERIQSFEHVVNALTHDASTLGGNSGSAILEVATGKVLALHFAGLYLKANYGVPMFELARDRRVVASLLNFEGTLASTNDWEPAWQGVSSEDERPALAPIPLLQTPSPAPAQTVTWTIPLNITVSIGQPAQVIAAAPVTAAVPQETEEKVIVDQDYSNRPGYDPDFLGSITVPLPTLTEAMKKDTVVVSPEARKHKDPFELTYFHYSVYMNKRRRTAWFSAANIDGKQRPAIGARSGDRWYIDTRIGRDEQMGQEAYEHGIDRGHLTRRDDTAWGKDVATATAANNDTFHFTNCALQAAMFNRGRDRWQGLEQFLLEQHAKKDKKRMTVITGPVFAAIDPAYQNEKMKYSIRCPLQYWKVCVLVREDDTVSATAFILGQDEIKDLPGFEEAAFDVAATQVKIADLEKRTGLSFGDLKKHDHFAQGGAAGTIEAPTGPSGATESVRLIRRASDIVV